MQKFGTFTPNGLGRFILTLAKLGFGRGRLKKIFAQIWNQAYGDEPADIRYHGLNFRLHPRKNTIESKMMFSAKQREGAELKMISHHLSSGGIFVDIGANIGYYALNAARLGADRVLAIEPNPMILARLQENVALNKLSSKIALHAVAVGATPSFADLIIAENDFGSSSIVNKTVGSNHVNVQVMPLVDILEKDGANMADVIKIDIEGMEDRALFPYFEKIKPKNYPKLIIMEDGINAHWERDILSWLLTNGYHKVGRTRGNIMLQLS